MSTLGERLKQIRGNRSQDQFARDIGIGKNSLGFYERDERTPNATTVAAIVKKLGVSPDWLLFGEGPMRRNQLSEDQDSTPSLARSKMFAGAAFPGSTMGPSPAEDLNYLRIENKELREENRALREENSAQRKELRELLDELRELRKIEAEYLRMKPDRADDEGTEEIRNSA